MTDKDLLRESGAHNRRILRLYGQHLITRTEAIISLKLISGLGTAQAKAYQLRDPEILIKLEAGVEYGSYLSPSDLLATVAKQTGAHFPR
jgi:hypothetical protein